MVVEGLDKYVLMFFELAEIVPISLLRSTAVPVVKELLHETSAGENYQNSLGNLRNCLKEQLSDILYLFPHQILVSSVFVHKIVAEIDFAFFYLLLVHSSFFPLGLFSLFFVLVVLGRHFEESSEELFLRVNNMVGYRVKHKLFILQKSELVHPNFPGTQCTRGNYKLGISGDISKTLQRFSDVYAEYLELDILYVIQCNFLTS